MTRRLWLFSGTGMLVAAVIWALNTNVRFHLLLAVLCIFVAILDFWLAIMSRRDSGD